MPSGHAAAPAPAAAAARPGLIHHAFIRAFVVTTVVVIVLIGGLGRLIDPFGHFSSDYTFYPHVEDTPEQAYASTPYTLNRALFKVLNFEKFARAAATAGEPVNVLIGDSLANQIDPHVLARADGGRWFSLSYGTATAEENMVLIDDLVARHDVNTILWIMHFTRVEATHRDRMTAAIQDAGQPFVHLFRFETLRAMYYVLRHRLLGIPFADPIDGRDVEAIVAYQLSRFRLDFADRAWPEELVEAMDETIRRAEAKGVRVILVEPPVHPDLEQVFAEEMPEQRALYDAFLARHRTLAATGARVDDWPRELFVDQAHLRADARPALTEMIAAGLTASRTSSSRQPGQPAIH